MRKIVGSDKPDENQRKTAGVPTTCRRPGAGRPRRACHPVHPGVEDVTDVRLRWLVPQPAGSQPAQCLAISVSITWAAGMVGSTDGRVGGYLVSPVSSQTLDLYRR